MERCAASARAAGAFEVTVAGRLRAEEIPSAARNRDECDDPGSQRHKYWTLRWCSGFGLHLRRLADFERIDPDWLGDVLKLGRA